MRRAIIIAALVAICGAVRAFDASPLLPWVMEPTTDPYLVAWYKGDGNALDSSPFTRHGAWIGTAAYTNCQIGQAFSFNGSSAVTAAVSQASSAVTILFWARGRIPSEAIFIRLVCWRRGLVNYQLLGSGLAPGNQLQFGISTNGAALTHGISSSVIDFATCRHVAAVFTGAAAALYVDGVPQSTAYYGGMGLSPDGITSIGARADNLVTAYTGDIDDVRIYNRALSSNDVIRIYQGLTPLHD